MKITMQFLAQHMACHPARELFRQHWPDGGEVTRENLLLAAEQGFNITWLAEKILRPEARRVFEAPRAEALRVYRAAAAEAVAEAEAERVYDAAVAEALWNAWKQQEGAE